MKWEYDLCNEEHLARKGKALGANAGVDAIVKGLDDYGARGWELVTVNSDNGTTPYYYFKRLKEE